MSLFIGGGPFARTIVEEDCVSATLDAAKRQHHRVEDVFDALKWVLARSPEDGLSNRDGLYLIKSPEWAVAGVPVVLALYSFNDNQVNILDVAVLSNEQ